MTTTPATINFRLYQNATFSEPVTLENPDLSPMDLTGCTALMQVRRDIADLSPVFSLSTSNGGITLGGNTGLITLHLSATATAALAIDWEGELWCHGLLLTSADTVTVNKTYQGSIIALPSQVRP